MRTSSEGTAASEGTEATAATAATAATEISDASETRGSRGPPRGFALLSVLAIAVIVLVGAVAVVVTTRESSTSSLLDRRSGEAYSVALAGLTWAQANLDDNVGRSALAAAAAGTTTAVAGLNIHPFDADDPFAGVGAAPPASGSSNNDWLAFGRGHFGLTAAAEPLADAGFVVRVIGQVGDTQEVLETNVRVNVLKTMPAGLTGCFEGPVQVTLYDQESPYDYYGNMRFDGNGGVPLAMSEDHNRMNGLARFNDSSSSPPADVAPADPIAGYPKGRRWRGTQSLRAEPVASGVANGTGGLPATNLIDDNIGALASPNWSGNPYMANDPRLVDANNGGNKGLGLGAQGIVDGQTGAAAPAGSTDQRGLPIIAYIGTPGALAGFAMPLAANGFFRAEENWAPISKDNRARKGFYACDNHDGENSSLRHAVDVCIKGTTSNVGTAEPVAAAPNWTKNGLNHSGRAWGFVSSIVRQCTGSGDSVNPVDGSPWYDAVNNPNGVKCAGAFRWLENAAACLVVPPSVRQTVARGTSVTRPAAFTTAGVAVGGLDDDFKGCHPACLIAYDADGDGNEDHPYRSACVNLDSTNVTTYGPAIKTAEAAFAGADAAAFDTDTVAAGTQLPTYITSWHRAAHNLTGTIPDVPTALTLDQASDAVGNILSFPGFVSERGNPSLITRLDMTDRGPLGTCQQNCLAYGYGRDWTFGAHRTDIGSPGILAPAGAPTSCSAAVFNDTGATTMVHCNLDYDLDGRLDRKSYAIASAYREECADPHDGMSWGPAFNISDRNTNITGVGCPNTLPNFTGSTPATITPFCNQGELEGIRSAVAELEASGAIRMTSVAPLQAKGTLTDEGNWFGGARCHMGSTVTSHMGRPAPTLHPHGGAMASVPDTDIDVHGHPDYWIEEECDEQKVVIVDSADTGVSSINVGQICGCGVLIVRNTRLTFASGSHLLWRGIVVWEVNGAVSGDLLSASSTGFSTFVVEGGTLLTGNQDFTIKLTKAENDAVTITNNEADALKLYFRQNPDALTDVFGAVGSALRGVRRVR